MKLLVLILKLWVAMFRNDSERLRAIVTEIDKLRNGHEDNHVERR